MVFNTVSESGQQFQTNTKTMVKVLILSVIILAIAVAGLSIKLLISKKAQFSAGCGSKVTPEMKENGMGCGCGGGCHSS
jgi:ABC-type amino acid transport system permease subunit